MFDEQAFPLLAHRARSFRLMFKLLEERQKTDYLILETGCLRVPGNWAGDGQSSLLFDRFVNFHGGALHTVDLDPNACRAAQSVVTGKTTLYCMDSVAFLWQFDNARPADLIYLDSFDLDVNNPHPSTFHHMKELTAAWSRGLIRPGTILAVDDNIPNGPGKGAYVKEFLYNVGIAPVLEDYQIVWQL